MIKPFVFIDSAYGKQYSVDSAIADVTSNLTDVGFGFQFTYKDNLNGNLHFAFPVQDKFSDPDIVIEDEGMRVVFDIQYKF